MGKISAVRQSGGGSGRFARNGSRMVWSFPRTLRSLPPRNFESHWWSRPHCRDRRMQNWHREVQSRSFTRWSVGVWRHRPRNERDFHGASRGSLGRHTPSGRPGTCHPGSTIVSDEWAAYNALEECGFAHYTVNHSRHLVVPATGAHTKYRVDVAACEGEAQTHERHIAGHGWQLPGRVHVAQEVWQAW